MNNFPVLYIILGFIVIFALASVISNRFEKQRTEKLKAAALKLGYSFVHVPDLSQLSRFSGFALFSQGRERVVSNFMQGRLFEGEIMVFDYRYVIGSGKQRRVSKQTVVAVQSTRLKLSKFTLRPEDIFAKIGSVFGYQDIDFPAYPEFSSAFLLRGESEVETKSLFNQNVIAFYTEHKKACSEGIGNIIIYYLSDQRTKPETIRSFIDEAEKACRLFMH